MNAELNVYIHTIDFLYLKHNTKIIKKKKMT